MQKFSVASCKDGGRHPQALFLKQACISSLYLRVQEVKELGDLSPGWDALRRDVVDHCRLLIGCYRETLAELDKLSGEVG